MLDILKNLQDPSWWFTGLFPAFVVWLIPKAFRKLEPLARGLAKRSRLQNLKTVKRLRWDELHIQYLIGRANAHYTLFVALFVIFVLAALFTPARAALRSFPLTFLMASPVYIFELLWLTSDSKVKQAIKSRRRIGKRPSPLPNNSSKPTPLRGAA